MKRILAFLLASCMMLSLLTGCGASAKAKAAEELIGKIGTVTLDSKAAIDDALFESGEEMME